MFSLTNSTAKATAMLFGIAALKTILYADRIGNKKSVKCI